MIRWFHSFKIDSLPENVLSQYPSVMCASILPSVSDPAVAKRLIICLLAALRANGILKFDVVSFFVCMEFVMSFNCFQDHSECT